jgi:hypothetical protein
LRRERKKMMMSIEEKAAYLAQVELKKKIIADMEACV